MTGIQTATELEEFYQHPDPWSYETSADDRRRRTELLSLLPIRDFDRTLDIGCGNGFITLQLPGREVIGVDISGNAIDWARKAAVRQGVASRVRFERISILDPALLALGQFDLICITGVFYPQYLGKASSVVRQAIDQMLRSGGIAVSCHIRGWGAMRLPYTIIDAAVYPYREYTHQLEVMRK